MISFPSDVHPEVGSVGCVVILFLIYWGTSILFSIVGMYQFTSPLIVPHKGFLFCTPSPAFVTSRHSDRCEVIHRCGFDLHFPSDEHLFMCQLSISVFLGKCPLSVF